MSFNKVMFSSASDNWSTPVDLYKSLDDEFHFDFDPCPLGGRDGIDGLEIKWGKRNYINPPYGREIGKWIKKAFLWSHWDKSLCVMLIPSRTDTRWWHEYVMKAKEIRFIKGRLKFGGSKNSAPFPSCVVIFSPSRT